jgi:hypothetical protein
VLSSSKIVALRKKRTVPPLKTLIPMVLGVGTAWLMLTAGYRIFLWWYAFFDAGPNAWTLALTLGVTFRWLVVSFIVFSMFGGVSLLIHRSEIKLRAKGLALSFVAALSWVVAGVGLLIWTELRNVPSLATFFGSVVAGISAIKLLEAGSRLLARAKQTMARDADDVLRRDRRPPILYLRSFLFDSQAATLNNTLARREEALSWRVSNFAFWSARREWTYEEVICRALSRKAPVVAIGRPGEQLPQLGAARKYVSDDAWREEVADLIRKARAVFIVIGESDGLLWELLELFSSEETRHKTVLIIPRGEECATWDDFFNYLKQKYDPASLPARVPEDTLALTMRSLSEPLVFTGEPTTGNYLQIFEILFPANRGRKTRA